MLLLRKESDSEIPIIAKCVDRMDDSCPRKRFKALK